MLPGLLFLWILGCTGFVLGTLTLRGPVRWITAALRDSGAEQTAEDWVVRGTIVLLLLVSLGVAMLLVEAVRERLAELKERGFTGVITLLHPAVAPFEPALLEKEQEAARQVGIALVHTPMLPWVSQNEKSLETIRRLARSGAGRYYVHCYLGKDRVNVVRRLADVPAFERGSIYHLPGGVHVAPYPTDEEWFGYVLSGSVKQVLSLLDPGSPDDSARVAEERALLAKYHIPLEIATIRSTPYDPEQALAAARRARALPKPLMVHAFRTAGSAAAEAAGLRWVQLEAGRSATLFDLLASGGPWYLFGPGLPPLRAELEARLVLGTGIPDPT